MMNVIIVSGFISTDIKQQTIESGKQVTNFLLSAKQNTKYITYKVCLWGSYFDSIINYLSKNKFITVIGDFCYPTHYVDKEGVTRINLTINANKIDLLPREQKKEEPKVEQEPVEIEPELDF